MRKTATRFLCALCGMVMMFALLAGILAVPAQAAANGIYTATATPHYRHPTTGVIEDSGGESSEVLGQSMTESALDSRALVEVDADGSTYVTIRLKLMDNIQNPSFSVDGAGVSASLMQEDYSNNTADYRMRVNSEGSIIRCSMYVVPMGREVIFYITVSNLQAGSGDFITSITVQPAATQEQTTTSSSGSSSSSSSGSSSSSSSASSSSGSSSASSDSGQTDTGTTGADASEDADAENTEDLSAEEENEDLSAEEEVEGIAEFDLSAEEEVLSAEEELSADEEDLSAESETTDKDASGMSFGVVIAIVIAVVAAAAICVGVAGSKKKAAGNGEEKKDE